MPHEFASASLNGLMRFRALQMRHTYFVKEDTDGTIAQIFTKNGGSLFDFGPDLHLACHWRFPADGIWGGEFLPDIPGREKKTDQVLGSLWIGSWFLIWSAPFLTENCCNLFENDIYIYRIDKYTYSYVYYCYVCALCGLPVGPSLIHNLVEVICSPCFLVVTLYVAPGTSQVCRRFQSWSCRLYLACQVWDPGLEAPNRSVKVKAIIVSKTTVTISIII